MGIFETNGWRYIHDIDLGDGVTGSAYAKGELRAIISRDPIVERGVLMQRWHISVSCAKRYPSWEELKAARYDLVPDAVYMAQMLPPVAAYVDLHPNCFHLYEIPEDVAR